MADTVANLPLVLQQTGDVSRVQEVAQRMGEEQQAQARESDRAENLRRLKQVQQGDGADAHNRVQADQEKPEQQRRQRRRPQPKKGRQAEPAAAQKRTGGSGLVDVIV